MLQPRWKLSHQTVAGKAEHAPMGFFNLATNSLKLVANPIVGFLLVALHQRTVAHNIDAKNRGEPAFEPLPAGAPLLAQPLGNRLS